MARISKKKWTKDGQLEADENNTHVSSSLFLA
jgi:hypothetical protein